MAEEGYGHHHHHHFGHYHDHMPQRSAEAYNPEPVGELVSVYAESNSNYRLAVKPEGVVMAFKNRRDPQQQWIKMDMADKFVDSEGSPGFVLINKKTGLALKHGTGEGEAVTAEIWRPHSVDHTMLWSQSKDVGKGYTAIRMVTNIALNLDADHGDRKHGGIQDGHRLILFSWNKGENQKWKFEPLEVQE
ncbi:hypothetical protein R1flu_015047 [Riccia fluitans]|uniref:Ricin B lectin domain-containing protein n=1 Tax=Riccia fluitans TaxID=41844 RepID=A0ABD1YHT7_9MARC